MLYVPQVLLNLPPTPRPISFMCVLYNRTRGSSCAKGRSVSRCELKAAHGVHAPCDEQECVFWRVVGHLDVVEAGSGCAIQHFELLGDEGSDVVAWLLSVKERVESEFADDAAADTA